ncbi:MAG: hypothetical protein KAW09_03175, partial [Thermoplasmata archaeon]|nr:hypothetical protein [Thermoplasmata archaeon]
WLHGINGSIYFRRYNSFHILVIPDTPLYQNGTNEYVDAVFDVFGNIHLTWATDFFGIQSVMYAKIDKMGNTLVPALKVSVDNSARDHSSAIDVNSLGQAYIAWDYWWNPSSWWSEDIVYAKIDSDGSVIFTQQFVAPEAWDTAFYGRKDILVDGDDNVHVFFDRIYPSVHDIHLYYKKYASDGTTVLEKEKQLVPATYYWWSSTLEAVLDSNDKINIAYSFGVTGKRIEVFYTRINLVGTVELSPIRLSQDDMEHSHQAHLAIDDYENSYVFWRDNKDDSAEIYYSVVAPNGTVMVDDARLTNSLENESAAYMGAVFDSHDFCIWSYYNENGTYVVYHFPPLPPALKTEVVNNDDILLNWTAYDPAFTDHYLIFRSPHQRTFDFTDPFYDTSFSLIPLGTQWIDVDAAESGAPREYYYIVRAVSAMGMVSNTSNTAGKWTNDFAPGLNTLSLPLKPFEDYAVSWYAEQIPNVEFIRWMNSTGHWVTHRKGMGEGIDDSPVEMGKGYEISLTSASTFAFCGYPASMIRYHEGLGDSIWFRNGLSAQKNGSNITLDWNFTAGASRYEVLRSTVRNGVHVLSARLVVELPSTMNSWTDRDALSSEGEYYYTVIPVDADGFWGSSTYSVGVVTVEYEQGSDTFALPLKVIEARSLDWYCDAVPNVVGMAYMIQEVWKFHALEMPGGIYDSQVSDGEGYQVSSEGGEVRFTSIGH